MAQISIDLFTCKVYIISDKKICLACPHYGICTKAKKGRTIARLLNEEARRDWRLNMKNPGLKRSINLEKRK